MERHNRKQINIITHQPPPKNGRRGIPSRFNCCRGRPKTTRVITKRYRRVGYFFSSLFSSFRDFNPFHSPSFLFIISEEPTRPFLIGIPYFIPCELCVTEGWTSDTFCHHSPPPEQIHKKTNANSVFLTPFSQIWMMIRKAK